MKKAFLVLLAVCVVSVAVLDAQVAQRPRGQARPAAVPNFSGNWIVVSPEDEAGQLKEVKQTATTLTTGSVSEPGGEVVYRLDGRGTRQETRLQRTIVPTVTTAAWEERTLVITKETKLPDGRIQLSKQAWSLQADGHLAIVYSQSLAGQDLPTRTFVYKKEK